MSTNATFGPSALVTPANMLTLGRLVVSPLIFAGIVSWGSSWSLAAAWVIVAGSDGADGWLARRHGTTRSGAFLDPLADKILILAALSALVVRGELFWLPVVLIAIREIAMSMYRSWAGRRGISIPARRSAKVKTFIQDLAVLIAVIPGLLSQNKLPLELAVWVAVVLTWWTGLQYLVDGKAALRKVLQH